MAAMTMISNEEMIMAVVVGFLLFNAKNTASSSTVVSSGAPGAAPAGTQPSQTPTAASTAGPTNGNSPNPTGMNSPDPTSGNPGYVGSDDGGSDSSDQDGNDLI
jgi:hypothetical protein